MYSLEIIIALNQRIGIGKKTDQTSRNPDQAAKDAIQMETEKRRLMDWLKKEYPDVHNQTG